MTAQMNRRRFLAGLALGGTLRPAFGAPARKLKVGHTGITWGYKPDDAAAAIRDVGSLGYQGYETFGEVLEAWEPKGGLKVALDESRLPLVSAYCNFNLTDPARRSDEIARAVKWAKLIKAAGGVTAVIGPNPAKRPAYDFKAAKPTLVAALNEIAKAISDAGVVAALHQHTGTCIETRDEVYAILDAVDHKVVKFGPDIAQLAKGGVNPVKVVQDYLPLIHHIHFKDWDGGPHWTEYCPLGRGRIDLAAVLDLLEKTPKLKILMVELDPSRNPPHTPRETTAIAKAFLEKQGYRFNS
jgi:inosose dehydratase